MRHVTEIGQERNFSARLYVALGYIMDFTVHAVVEVLLSTPFDVSYMRGKTSILPLKAA